MSPFHSLYPISKDKVVKLDALFASNGIILAGNPQYKERKNGADFYFKTLEDKKFADAIFPIIIAHKRLDIPDNMI